mgnify:FL=1|jgi:hypothetical protein|tara:strand:- start:6465 stop:6695 length:231 start_codon:yes stop_codon:yes gene_type:complete
MAKQQVVPQPTPDVPPSQDAQIADIGNRIARSAIAVIDTIVQRGGFRGEELTTIGQLRDQCVQLTAMVEQQQLDGN